jgi:hypothetical protein
MTQEIQERCGVGQRRKRHSGDEGKIQWKVVETRQEKRGEDGVVRVGGVGAKVRWMVEGAMDGEGGRCVVEFIVDHECEVGVFGVGRREAESSCDGSLGVGRQTLERKQATIRRVVDHRYRGIEGFRCSGWMD